MPSTKIQDGNSIEFVAAADQASGDIIAVGKMVVTVHGDVKTGEVGVGHTLGVYSVPKATAATFVQGGSVYLKTGEVTNNATDSVYAGKAWAAGSNGDTTALVNLNFGSA